MTKRMPRTGAALLAIGLAFGGITGGLAFSATAAPVDPERQAVVSFDGNPDITDIQVDNNADVRIMGLASGEAVNIQVATARAATPTAFNNQSGDWNFTATVQGKSGLHIGNMFHNDSTGGPIGAGDVLRFTVTPATTAPVVYTYVIPATGGYTQTEEIEEALADPTAEYTAAEAFAGGVPVVLTGFDPTKSATVETMVAYYGEGSNFPVIHREYFTPAEVGADGIIETTIYGHSKTDDTVALSAGDTLFVQAYSGAAGPAGSFLGIDIVGEPVTATFTPAAPTAVELNAGVSITFEELDPSQYNTYSIDVAKAATPTVFGYDSGGVIPASAIVSGVATLGGISINNPTGGAVLEEDDIVRITVQNSTGDSYVALTYVVGGGVVVPPEPSVPAGSFETAAPTSGDFLDGTPYTLTGLDSTVPNSVIVYAASAAAPTVFTEVITHAVPSASIVDGEYTFDISVFYDGATNTPLNAGDVVQVRLVVDGAAEVVTTTYVIPGVVVEPPVPGTPAGAFDPASPTAAQLAEGAPYIITGLDNTATNVVSVSTKYATESSFGTPSTATIDNADIVDGEYAAEVEAYSTLPPSAERIPLSAGDVVRITLTVDGGTPVVLTDYTIPASQVPGGDDDGDDDGAGNGGNLAQTGTADDRQIQNIGLFILGGGLTAGFAIMGIKLMRKRNEESLELV